MIQIKREYVITKEQYLQLKENFKKAKCHSPSEYLIYNILRSWPANRGFTPITNPIKLANGQQPNQAFDAAKLEIEFNLKRKLEEYKKQLTETFGESIITEDILKLIQEQIK